MPIRDLIVALSLMVGVLLIAFVGNAVGSEYYLFLPSRGLHTPPTSPWFLAIPIFISVGVFFLSRRYAAIIIAVLPLMAFLGIPAGALFFDWTPGIAQYLLILCLGGLAMFIWSHDHLHED